MKKSPLQNPIVVVVLVAVAAGAVYLQFRKPPDRVRLEARAKRAPAAAIERAKLSAVNVAAANAAAPAAPVAETPAAAEPPSPAALEAATVAAKTATLDGPVPVSNVDVAYVKQHLAKWVDAPSRDPFGMYPRPSKSLASHTNSAAQVLQVSAIWRQTGKRLAVINNEVTTENSEIMGYRIVEIEAKVVRLTGPLGPEQITLAEFGQAPGRVSTNRIPAAVISSTHRQAGG